MTFGGIDHSVPVAQVSTQGSGSRSGTPFRLDIEGLRGMAIGLVVLYHVGAPGFDGGFVGVDIFFVISGFLITQLLIRELRSTGRIDYFGFLARRVRRLLPAALLVAVATFGLAKLVLPTLALLELKRDALATLGNLSNYWFAHRGADYLHAHATASPFQQYWSLAVEEQFYLIWPILLLLLTVLGRRAGAGRVRRVGIVVVLVASFALCLHLAQVSQPWAFFGLPTRAWQLAVGGLIAATMLGERGWPPARARVVSWAGLGLVVAAPVAAASGPTYPGWAATVPVTGAALLIIAGARSGGVVQSLLSGPVLTGIGRLSYSIYLWHWPLLLLAGGIRGGDLSWPGRLGVVAGTVLLAGLTYRFVENPLRRQRWLSARPIRSLAAGATATVAAVGVSLLLAVPPPLHAGRTAQPIADAVDPASWTGGPDPASWTGYVPTNLTPPLRAAKWDRPAVYEGCHSPFPQIHPPESECVYGQPDSAATIVLFGDSHATNWFPPLQRIALRHRLRLVSLTKSACPSVAVTVFNDQLKRAYWECDRWREAALARIGREEPRLVILTNSTNTPHDKPGSVPEDEWLAGLARTLDRLAAVPDLMVLADTPHARTDVPSCLSENITTAHVCALPRSGTVDDAFNARVVGLVEERNRRAVDPNDTICGADRCPAIVGDLLVYRDRDHLTPAFALALTGLLDRHVTELLGAPPLTGPN